MILRPVIQWVINGHQNIMKTHTESIASEISSFISDSTRDLSASAGQPHRVLVGRQRPASDAGKGPHSGQEPPQKKARTVQQPVSKRMPLAMRSK